MMISSFLRTALDRFDDYRSEGGEIIDPVAGEPVQYGTPCHASAQAVLAGLSKGKEQALRLELAAAGLRSAICHVADVDARPNLSGMAEGTGECGFMNHRDFFWPPLWRTWRILRNLGHVDAGQMLARLQEVDIEKAFRTRPPSNWAAVWLSGEWIRFREGFSPFPMEWFDEALGAFFKDHITLDMGFYHEPGHPNSYDLFTRYHLAVFLQEGYEGKWKEPMWELLRTGLSRSLQVQLSDGSLGTAYRSSGQTWTLGCQCAFFALAARLLEATDGELAGKAMLAAQRSAVAMLLWQRESGPFSPVENRFPPSHRIGYEAYTFDGNYSNLALAFLAQALENGLPDSPDLPNAEELLRPPSGLAEGDPLYRGVVHAGHYSAHLNGFPSVAYDTAGLVDITFGPGRLLQFVSPVIHSATNRRFLVGLALRRECGPTLATRICDAPTVPTGPPQLIDPAGLRLELRSQGKNFLQVMEVTANAAEGIFYRESYPGQSNLLTWFIPYLRDFGDGRITSVQIEKSSDHSQFLFQNGSEKILLRVDGRADHVTHLTHGFTSRRGLCGLIRIDLAEPAQGGTCSFQIV